LKASGKKDVLVPLSEVQGIVKDAIEEYVKPSIALSDWESDKPDLSDW
jgi:hypothetical protein